MWNVSCWPIKKTWKNHLFLDSSNNLNWLWDHPTLCHPYSFVMTCSGIRKFRVRTVALKVFYQSLSHSILLRVCFQGTCVTIICHNDDLSLILIWLFTNKFRGQSYLQKLIKSFPKFILFPFSQLLWLYFPPFFQVKSQRIIQANPLINFIQYDF